MSAVKRSRDDEPAGFTVSRWSTDKFHNAAVPNYLPPEFVLHDSGNSLEAFLLRAQAADAKRLLEQNIADDFFVRRGGHHMKVPPKYDLSGRRTNTFEAMLEDKQEKIARDIQEKQKRIQAIIAASSGLIAEREIVKKVYFTEQQMETRAYGAILGARGATHQKLEKETSTHIVLAGKGITDIRKKVNMRNQEQSADMAEERPHCRITGTSEHAIQLATEKIEWILSDDPEAEQFRDDNRRNLAMINGTYNADTWGKTIPGQPGAAAGGAAGGAASGAAKGGAPLQPEAPELDEDVTDFLADL